MHTVKKQVDQPPFKNAIKSERSFSEARPWKAIALPGAKLEGLANHLSKLLSVHLRVALAESDEE